MARIDIALISDLVCSWSPIGYRHVKAALTRLAPDVHGDLRFLPFQLNPQMPAEGERIDDHLARRMGWSAAQIAEYKVGVVRHATEAGVTIDYARRTRYWNTFDAHCLLHASHARDRQAALVEALHDAYYRAGSNLADRAVLFEAASRAGLDEAFVSTALDSQKIRADVRAREASVRDELGVRSVPTLLVNGSLIVVGSNSPDYFADLFRRIAEGHVRSVARLAA